MSSAYLSVFLVFDSFFSVYKTYTWLDWDVLRDTGEEESFNELDGEIHLPLWFKRNIVRGRFITKATNIQN